MRAIFAGLIAAAVVAGSAAADEAASASSVVAAPPGALACSGCHGDGSSLPLDALSAADILEAMVAFKSGARDATLMNRIAAGFDDAELAAIAAWIARGD